MFSAEWCLYFSDACRGYSQLIFSTVLSQLFLFFLTVVLLESTSQNHMIELVLPWIFAILRLFWRIKNIQFYFIIKCYCVIVKCKQIKMYSYFKWKMAFLSVYNHEYGLSNYLLNGVLTPWTYSPDYRLPTFGIPIGTVCPGG